jgi:hypothetical protein
MTTHLASLFARLVSPAPLDGVTEAAGDVPTAVRLGGLGRCVLCERRLCVVTDVGGDVWAQATTALFGTATSHSSSVTFRYPSKPWTRVDEFHPQRVQQRVAVHRQHRLHSNLGDVLPIFGKLVGSFLDDGSNHFVNDNGATHVPSPFVCQASCFSLSRTSAPHRRHVSARACVGGLVVCLYVTPTTGNGVDS